MDDEVAVGLHDEHIGRERVGSVAFRVLAAIDGIDHLVHILPDRLPVGAHRLGCKQHDRDQRQYNQHSFHFCLLCLNGGRSIRCGPRPAVGHTLGEKASAATVSSHRPRRSAHRWDHSRSPLAIALPHLPDRQRHRRDRLDERLRTPFHPGILDLVPLRLNPRPCRPPFLYHPQGFLQERASAFPADGFAGPPPWRCLYPCIGLTAYFWR